MLRLLFSPIELALTVVTHTVALPICTVSLTFTQILHLESRARGPVVNGSHSRRRWRASVVKADGPGPTLKIGGVGMQRRLSSTSSALIPVPEEEERDAWETDDDDQTYHTCDEDEMSVAGETSRKRHNTLADRWDVDENDEEGYSLTPRLLSDLFSLDDKPGNSAVTGMPLSPSLFTSVDPSVPSLFDEPVPFTSPASGWDSSPNVDSSASSSPNLSTPGNSPPLHMAKQPRPSSPDPRQGSKARTQHRYSRYTPKSLSFAQVAGLPPQNMGGGTFQASEGTPLRGLGLHGQDAGSGGRSGAGSTRRK